MIRLEASCPHTEPVLIALAYHVLKHHQHSDRHSHGQISPLGLGSRL